MRYLNLVLLLSLTLSSCKEPFQEEQALLESIIGGKLSNKKQLILVMPDSGCSSCISRAEEFMMQHYACEQLIFIVDAAYTKKLLTIRFGAQIAQSTQILQDKERLFSKKGLLATYPIYYLVENGAILKKETLSVSQKEAFGFYKEEAQKLCK